jgi:plasmid stabilization system protein ParE
VAGTYEKSIPRFPYVIAYSLTMQGGQEVVAILRVIHTSRDWPPEGWPG